MTRLPVSPAKRGCGRLPALHGYRSRLAGGHAPARSQQLGDRGGRGEPGSALGGEMGRWQPGRQAAMGAGRGSGDARDPSRGSACEQGSGRLEA